MSLKSLNSESPSDSSSETTVGSGDIEKEGRGEGKIDVASVYETSAHAEGRYITVPLTAC